MDATPRLDTETPEPVEKEPAPQDTKAAEDEVEIVRIGVTAPQAIRLTQATGAAHEAKNRASEVLSDLAKQYMEKDVPMMLKDFDFDTGELVFLRKKQPKSA